MPKSLFLKSAAGENGATDEGAPGCWHHAPFSCRWQWREHGLVDCYGIFPPPQGWPDMHQSRPLGHPSTGAMGRDRGSSGICSIKTLYCGLNEIFTSHFPHPIPFPDLPGLILLLLIVSAF